VFLSIFLFVDLKDAFLSHLQAPLKCLLLLPRRHRPPFLITHIHPHQRLANTRSILARLTITTIHAPLSPELPHIKSTTKLSIFHPAFPRLCTLLRHQRRLHPHQRHFPLPIRSRHRHHAVRVLLFHLYIFHAVLPRCQPPQGHSLIHR
jgi:hypothetical protein